MEVRVRWYDEVERCVITREAITGGDGDVWDSTGDCKVYGGGRTSAIVLQSCWFVRSSEYKATVSNKLVEGRTAWICS